MPRALDIKNEYDFSYETLCSICPQETVTICGFDDSMVYSDAKAKIIKLLCQLKQPNLLILDLTDITEISMDFDKSATFLGPTCPKNRPTDINIIAIAPSNLHKKIKKFGIDAFSTLEEYESNIRNFKKIA